MHFVDQFYAWLRGDLDGEINHDRQYRLMKIVGIELIILGFCIIYVYILCGLWIIVVLISILNLIGFLNLYLLYRTKNSLRCGHILTTSILVAAVFANLCVGGVDSSYFVWFHVTPVIAAIAVGRTGLIIYSAITFVMIIFCAMVIVQPLYSIDNTYKFSLDLINYLFSLLIIVTALFNMLRENAYYERLLYERNYMLQADKEKFHHLSRYDTLTNLPNRAYFQTTLESRIETISRDDCLTVFFMDLDGFKLVNDYYGHETGDELLLQTAKRLQECFREGDFLARLGGF